MKIVLGTMTFSDQVDEPTAETMLSEFRNTRYHEVDTAYVYNAGETEKLLGRLNKKGALRDTAMAGKANPAVGGGLSPKSVTMQITESLARLQQTSFDLFYLHSPDLDTPIIETLGCINELHAQGLFKRFGLSNYAAWQVAEITELCKQNGWIQPTVYQGMYNALTRDIERELLPCLANYDMSFYVYNPLAGGMLTGKHSDATAHPDTGRFSTNTQYQDRYWKPDMLSVVQDFANTCKAHNIPPASAALRWLNHHSALANSDHHAIIIGSSTLDHLKHNLESCEEGPLPDAVVQSLDEGWEQVRPVCIKYFRP